MSLTIDDERLTAVGMNPLAARHQRRLGPIVAPQYLSGFFGKGLGHVPIVKGQLAFEIEYDGVVDPVGRGQLIGLVDD